MWRGSGGVVSSSTGSNLLRRPENPFGVGRPTFDISKKPSSFFLSLSTTFVRVDRFPLLSGLESRSIQYAVVKNYSSKVRWLKAINLNRLSAYIFWGCATVALRPTFAERRSSEICIVVMFNGCLRQSFFSTSMRSEATTCDVFRSCPRPDWWGQQLQYTADNKEWAMSNYRDASCVGLCLARGKQRLLSPWLRMWRYNAARPALTPTSEISRWRQGEGGGEVASLDSNLTILRIRNWELGHPIVLCVLAGAYIVICPLVFSLSLSYLWCRLFHGGGRE